MVEVLRALGAWSEIKLALLALLIAMWFVARSARRRRSLRPPYDAAAWASLDPSLRPQPPARARCTGCGKEDRGERGWARTKGVLICGECLLGTYDGQ